MNRAHSDQNCATALHDRRIECGFTTPIPFASRIFQLDPGQKYLRRAGSQQLKTNDIDTTESHTNLTYRAELLRDSHAVSLAQLATEQDRLYGQLEELRSVNDVIEEVLDKANPYQLQIAYQVGVCVCVSVCACVCVCEPVRLISLRIWCSVADAAAVRGHGAPPAGEAVSGSDGRLRRPHGELPAGAGAGPGQRGRTLPPSSPAQCWIQTRARGQAQS